MGAIIIEVCIFNPHLIPYIATGGGGSGYKESVLTQDGVVRWVQQVITDQHIIRCMYCGHAHHDMIMINWHHLVEDAATRMLLLVSTPLRCSERQTYHCTYWRRLISSQLHREELAIIYDKRMALHICLPWIFVKSPVTCSTSWPLVSVSCPSPVLSSAIVSSSTLLIIVA